MLIAEVPLGKIFTSVVKMNVPKHFSVERAEPWTSHSDEGGQVIWTTYWGKWGQLWVPKIEMGIAQASGGIFV